MFLNRSVVHGFVALVAAVVAVPAIADYERVNEPNPGDPMAVHIYKLDNGLTVYLTENHETPRFYAEIAVRAGSKQDPAESTGLAHYLEHLLFKGTDQLGTIDYEAEKPHLDRISELYEKHFHATDPDERAEIYAEINAEAQQAAQYAVPNEMDNLYNAMGATHLNAHTSDEETVYKVGLPANRLEQWAVIESERFADPVFRIFHTELETVYEEKNRSLDNRDWITHEALARALFPMHPYGQQPTIGLVEHLKNPSLVNIHEYFETYYVPNNMAICISGDIDIEETIEVIDRHFSALEPRPLPEPKTWENTIEGEVRTSVNYPGEEEVRISWLTAPKGHPDEYALTLADFVLDNSVAGLVNINLNQRQAVRQAAAYHQFRNDAGTETISGVPKDGQTLEEVEALLLEQIDLLKRGEFEDWLIPAIINDFKKSEKAQLESDMARVSMMRESFLSFEKWEETLARLEKMEQVTKEDVVRVANKYFGEDRVVLTRHDAQNELPQIEKPPIDPLDIDPTRRSKFAMNVAAMDVEPMKPAFVKEGRDFEVRTLSNGNTLYYTPNPLNDLFSFAIVVEKGVRHDDRLGYATQLLDKSGAGDLTAEELKKEWYKLGTDFGMSAGDQSTTVSLSGLDENFGKSLALMHTVLTQPTVEQDVLDALVAIALIQREDNMKDPQVITRALYNYNRYGQESPFLTRIPAENLKALTVDELLALVREFNDYKCSIMYTGSLPIDEVVAAIDEHRPLDGELKEPPEHIYFRARTPEATEIYFFDKDIAQSQVRFEFADGLVDEDIRTAVELYNEYFGGGMSGVVFQELREARALAYAAAAYYATGDQVGEENLVLGVIGCQADKTPEAVDAFIHLFNDMPESGERFARAKDGMINQYGTSKIGFRGLNAVVRAWEKLGLEPDPRKHRFKRLQTADFQDLLAFVETRIENSPKLISIVGPKSRVGFEKLQEIAPVRELTLDDIFVM